MLNVEDLGSANKVLAHLDHLTPVSLSLALSLELPDVGLHELSLANQLMILLLNLREAFIDLRLALLDLLHS